MVASRWSLARPLRRRQRRCSRSVFSRSRSRDRRSSKGLGLLLFGREDVIRTAVPVHEVAFQRLSGSQVKVNDFFRWPLLRVMDELEARHRAHNQEQELLVGMIRVGVPDYPFSAYREGVANARIHRDYAPLGAIHVQWHDDRLQISSPGGFPEGVRLDNLLVTDPRPRNPCSPTPSSGPGSSNGRRGESTRSSTRSFAAVARRRRTSAALRRA